MADKNGIVLYSAPASFFSQKVLLALYEKKLPFSTINISLGASEQCEPWFLEKNPLGQVPCIEHGNKIVSDSAVILKYLDDHFEPRLMPDPATAYGKRVTHYKDLLESLDIPTLSFGCLFAPDQFDMESVTFLKPSSKDMIAKEVILNRMRAMAVKHPTMEYLYSKKIKDSVAMFTKIQDPCSIAAAVEQADKTMREIEAELKLRSSQEKWLCGPERTVADIVLAVTLHRFELVGLQPKLFSMKSNPLLSNYYERLPNILSKYQEVCVEGTSNHAGKLVKAMK